MILPRMWRLRIYQNLFSLSIDSKKYTYPLEKEKQDYAYCLNKSLSTNLNYVMLVENDAIPSGDFSHVLGNTLSTHILHRFDREDFR